MEFLPWSTFTSPPLLNILWSVEDLRRLLRCRSKWHVSDYLRSPLSPQTYTSVSQYPDVISGIQRPKKFPIKCFVFQVFTRTITVLESFINNYLTGSYRDRRAHDRHISVKGPPAPSRLGTELRCVHHYMCTVGKVRWVGIGHNRSSLRDLSLKRYKNDNFYCLRPVI